MTKKEDFARRMSDEIFTMRVESDFLGAEQTPEEFINKIIENPEHIKGIKKLIYDNVLIDVTENPDWFVTDKDGDYQYSYDACYDYCYLVDGYIETQYENVREARLKVRYKIWVEVERIEYDPETGEESYSDTDFPESIAYRETFEDAAALQQQIVQVYGEI